MNSSTDTVSEGQTRETMTERLAARAHETVDQVAGQAQRKERELRDAVSRTADHARELGERARTTAEQRLERISSYLENHPVACVGIACVGIAFAAGVLLSTARRS
jgi:ElaB/YqjD/DUF883 family membrane-anchored ribosome-binding protein